MPKQLSANPEIRFPNNCPILEALTSRSTDMCLKDKLEETDLDILGVTHSRHHWHEADFYGVTDSWMD